MSHSASSPVKSLIGLIAAVLTVAGDLVSAQESSPTNAATAPAAIQQDKPTFFVNVEADQSSQEYWEGEQLTLTVRCEVAAHLYAIYTQADQQSYVILPNSGSSRDAVPAREKIQIPGEKDAFRWNVSAPFGKEHIKVIACRQRIQALERPELRRGQATPLTAAQLQTLLTEIRARIPAADWTETTLALTTHAGLNPKSPYAGRRHALFFGVDEHIATSILNRAGKLIDRSIPTSFNDLGLSVLMDTQVADRVFKKWGQFESTVCIPDIREPEVMLPTRERMKQEITGRLAQSTQPGDTVVIFYSGHGDDFGDQRSPGGKTSYLVPEDAIDVLTLLALRALNDAGQAEPRDKVLLARAEDWLQSAGLVVAPRLQDLAKLTEEQVTALNLANTELLRQSCITDNEFMHWLQALSGRRVMVILHACHSGGFVADLNSDTPGAGPLKQLASPPTVPGFRFLQPQIGRLKGIGMTNVGLLAAAQHNQSALTPHWNPGQPDPRDPATTVVRETLMELAQKPHLSALKNAVAPRIDPLGIFTFYLLNAILKSPGSLSLEAASRQVELDMAAYFKSPEFQAQIDAANQQRLQRGETPLKPEELPFQPIWSEPREVRMLLKP